MDLEPFDDTAAAAAPALTSDKVAITIIHDRRSRNEARNLTLRDRRQVDVTNLSLAMIYTPPIEVCEATGEDCCFRIRIEVFLDSTEFAPTSASPERVVRYRRFGPFPPVIVQV